jgi:hypothetical protein
MTENRAAAAAGFWDEWFTWPTSNKPANVALPDDDTGSGIGSYIAVGGRQSFSLGSGAIPPGDVINSVTVHGRMVHDPVNPASTFRFFLRLGGVESYGPTLNTPDGPTWYDIEQTIARPGGGAWSLADLASLEIGVHSVSGDWSWCTTMYAIIDYSPPAPAASGAMLLVF